MKYRFFFALSLLLCSCSTCTTSNTASEESRLQEIKEGKPSRRQLRRQLYQEKAVLVVYGAKDQALQKRYQALLEEVASAPQRNWRGHINVSYKSVAEIEEADLKTNILFLVGTAEDHPLIKKLSASTPFDFSAEGFRDKNQLYTAKEEILSMGLYPNVKNERLPMSLLTGNDAEMVFRFLEHKFKSRGSILGQNMDYEIYRAETKIIMGNFNRDWQIDPKVYFDYSAKCDTIYQSKHFDFIAHKKAIPLEQAANFALATQVEESTEALIQFIGSKKELPRMEYHMYKTAEDKGMMLGSTLQAHYDTLDNTVHTIVNDQYKDNYIQKEHQLIIHHLLGPPKSIALKNGLAIYFTKQWQRAGFRYWSARLAASGNGLSLKELFDAELIQKESPLMTDCFSASLVAFLIDHWGKAEFLDRYKNWIPTAMEIEKLESLWTAYLAELAISFPKKVKPARPLAYLKGFNFAHEGYSIYNGYLSSMATRALEKQASLGVNATAIVPYSYIRDEEAPGYLPISQNAGSENDQGVIHSAFEAKKMGMTTMIKPQIFFRNSWPGALDWETEEQWEAFFDYYYRWIRHYAFLSEIHDVDALCVGVEFVIATLSHEEEWRKIFRKLRGFYQGQMTYAANWGDEFEQVTFWDELDFIGLNCYYPLSKKDDPSDRELKKNFELVKDKMVKVAEKYNKQIVFTEIGFRSINAPWKNPHAEGDDSFNDRHQERCYDVVFKGIENADWCNGILWWKFPTYLGYRGARNNAFTPNNKKTEKLVKKWFMK